MLPVCRLSRKTASARLKYLNGNQSVLSTVKIDCNFHFSFCFPFFQKNFSYRVFTLFWNIFLDVEKYQIFQLYGMKQNAKTNDVNYNLWKYVFTILKIMPKVDLWRKRLTSFFELFSSCMLKIEFPEKWISWKALHIATKHLSSKFPTYLSLLSLSPFG